MGRLLVMVHVHAPLDAPVTRAHDALYAFLRSLDLKTSVLMMYGTKKVIKPDDAKISKVRYSIVADVHLKRLYLEMQVVFQLNVDVTPRARVTCLDARGCRLRI